MAATRVRSPRSYTEAYGYLAYCYDGTQRSGHPEQVPKKHVERARTLGAHELGPYRDRASPVEEIGVCQLLRTCENEDSTKKKPQRQQFRTPRQPRKVLGPSPGSVHGDTRRLPRANTRVKLVTHALLAVSLAVS
jgi:hypothetical protein